jgi:hypothetical protein
MRELGVEVVEGEVERILEDVMRRVMREQEAESREQ